MKDRLPVIFVGHGNPMHAILESNFSRGLTALASRIERPKAILCISAHWMTEGTWVTHMPKPKTIHDFYGFPKPLFDVQYPAPGSPTIAEQISQLIKYPRIQLDDDTWGFDHGTWAILRHMYPDADIPVLQMSLDMNATSDQHFKLGQELRRLREEGVLIVGSGNVVHNLRQFKPEVNATPYPWALEFDEWLKQQLVSRNYDSIINDSMTMRSGQLSSPTPDHWYPLFYVLGASDDRDSLKFEYEGIEHASISMRTFSLGMNA